MYTQPKLYEKINRHPDTLTVFGKQLLDEGTCSAQTLEEIKAMVNRTLEADFQAAKTWEVHNSTQHLLQWIVHRVLNCPFTFSQTLKYDWLSSKVRAARPLPVHTSP